MHAEASLKRSPTVDSSVYIKISWLVMKRAFQVEDTAEVQSLEEKYIQQIRDFEKYYPENAHELCIDSFNEMRKMISCMNDVPSSYKKRRYLGSARN